MSMWMEYSRQPRRLLRYELGSDQSLPAMSRERKGERNFQRKDGWIKGAGLG